LVRRAISTNRLKKRTEQADRGEMFRLLEDTISDRDRRIQGIEQKLGEITARASNQADIEGAKGRVSKKLGAIWDRLHSDTRKHLAVADAFSQEPLSKNHPDIPPCYFFKALNAELQAYLFQPGGTLDSGMLDRLKVYSPVALLIEFERNITLCREDVIAIRDAVDTVGGKSSLCSRTNIEQLKRLRDHRNWVEHPEHRRRPYSQERLHDLLHSIWKNDWLAGFLRRLHDS